jgi:hypothetical protein
MSKIYRDSFRYFFASLPALVGFAAIIEVLLWVLQPRSESSATFGALVIVAYFFHRHFLFGETLSLGKPKAGAGVPPYKFGWFVLVSLGIILVPVAVGLGLAFGYLGRPSAVALMLIFLPVYLLTLSLFGTALPATVARDNTYHLSQGLRATFSTMWRLVLGPGVIGAVVLVLTVLGGNALGAAGVQDGSLIVLAYYVVIRTMGFLTTIIAVAVLCEMYRRTRPAPSGSILPTDQTPA